MICDMNHYNVDHIWLYFGITVCQYSYSLYILHDFTRCEMTLRVKGHAHINILKNILSVLCHHLWRKRWIICKIFYLFNDHFILYVFKKSTRLSCVRIMLLVCSAADRQKALKLWETDCIPLCHGIMLRVRIDLLFMNTNFACPHWLATRLISSWKS